MSSSVLYYTINEERLPSFARERQREPVLMSGRLVCVERCVSVWSEITSTECDSPLRESREALWHQFVIISCLCHKVRIFSDEVFVRVRVYTCGCLLCLSALREQRGRTHNNSN